MKTIGLIVNPVAGIGGKVGLKGSDGEATQRKALDMGAVPESGIKAKKAMEALKGRDDIKIITCLGRMGENICRELGLLYETVPVGGDKTVPEDTVAAARYIAAQDVSCIVFAGGDGTARNILDAKVDIPVIGIPAGCKIHSAVYAVNPRCAGRVINNFIDASHAVSVKNAEVMAIDEELFRQGIVEAKLYGYLKALSEKDMTQSLKSGRGLSEEAATSLIASYICDNMQKDVLYIVGSGSTTKAITNFIGEDGTLLGVDLVVNKKIIKKDVSEKDILAALEEYDKAKIIITVIGGQGFIFGRGNQQLSSSVLKKVGKENILIAATKKKLIELIGKPLLIDTGDDDVNKYLSGYYRIITGYDDFAVFPAKN